MGDMSHKRFLANHKYRRALQCLKVRELRRHHDEVFQDSRWWVDIPQWVDRILIERRLWFYRCAGNFHYKKDDPRAVEFRSRAVEFLSPDTIKSQTKEEQAAQRIKELHTFSRRNCKTMPIEEIDRYLATLGLHLVDVRPGQRRKALFEFFNSSTAEIGGVTGKESLRVRRRSHKKISSGLVLKELILKHPEMRFYDFREMYGVVMPTVTRNSFKVTRCKLKAAGYDLPRLATRQAGERGADLD